VDAVVFTGPGEVEVRSYPAPEPGPGEVLVDVQACGVCTFERRLFAGQKRWYPISPGHEAAGVVSAVGDAVKGLAGSPQVGDLVAMDLRTRCGACRPCRRGRTSLCLHRQGRRLPDGTVLFGGLAGQAVVCAEAAHPMGDAPVEHAAMAEPVACCAHSLRRGGFRPGDRVAVVGGGLMGRLHMALARVGGAASVGVIDVSSERLESAREAGASWVAAPEEAVETGGKQDVVFVTAAGGVDLAVEMADRGGAVVLYSAFDETTLACVGADRSHREEVDIVGAFSQEPEDWRLSAALIRSGALADDLGAMITASFGFDSVLGAMTLVTTQPTFRVFVKPPERE